MLERIFFDIINPAWQLAYGTLVNFNHRFPVINIIMGCVISYSIVRFLVYPFLKRGVGRSDSVKVRKGDDY